MEMGVALKIKIVIIKKIKIMKCPDMFTAMKNEHSWLKLL